MDAIKQVNPVEEAAIGLASVSLKRKTENAGLSNSMESRDETPERGLEQVGRNDPSDVVSEGSTKNREGLSRQKRFQNVLGIQIQCWTAFFLIKYYSMKLCLLILCQKT